MALVLIALTVLSWRQSTAGVELMILRNSVETAMIASPLLIRFIFVLCLNNVTKSILSCPYNKDWHGCLSPSSVCLARWERLPFNLPLESR